MGSQWRYSIKKSRLAYHFSQISRGRGIALDASAAPQLREHRFIISRVKFDILLRVAFIVEIGPDLQSVYWCTCMFIVHTFIRLHVPYSTSDSDWVIFCYIFDECRTDEHSRSYTVLARRCLSYIDYHRQSSAISTIETWPWTNDWGHLRAHGLRSSDCCCSIFKPHLSWRTCSINGWSSQLQ